MADIARKLKSKRPAGKSAKRRRSHWLRRVFIWRRALAMAALAVLAGTLAAGWLAWQQGRIHAAAAALRDAGFARTAQMGLRIEDVSVYGREETDPALLRETLALERGMPILAYDIADARDRALALPWVQNVRIERRLPQRITVHITERHPIAIWQKDGQRHLIDREGSLLSREEAEIARFADMPVVTGPDAPREAAQILALVAAEPLLAGRVRGLTRRGGRRWDLVFENGTTARLPENMPEMALGRLALMQRRDDVLDRGIGIIDLRQNDRVTVSLPDYADGAVPQAEAPAAPGEG